MSETSSEEKDPRQALWWGLSIITFLAGLGLAGFAAFIGPSWPPFALSLAMGLYFTITGAVALQARFQMVRADLTSAGRHRRRADLALLLASAPLFAIVLRGGQDELRTLLRPPTVIVGQIESLYSHDGRSKGVRIRLEGRDTPLWWKCGWFTCDARERVMAVPQGATVQVAAVGNKVVGLRAGGSERLSPKVEQQRLVREQAIFLSVTILIMIVALVYAWRWTFGWRARDRKAEQLALNAFRGRDWPGLDERKP